MHNFGILTKLNFKQYFALPTDPKAKKKKIGAFIGISCCFLPIIAFLCVGIYSIAGYAATHDMAQYLLGSIMLISQIMVLFFGTAAFMGIMFFSKDNEFLNTLPIKPVAIYTSKLFMVYLSHIITTLFIMIPSIITIAIAAGKAGVAMGAEYYIFGLIGSFIVPLLPLLLITLIAMPLAYICKFFKRSQIMTTILAIVMFVGIMAAYMIGVYSLTGSIDNGTNPEEILAQSMNTFVVMSKIMYPNLFLANAMVGVNIAANLFTYLGIIVVAGAVAVGLSILMYKRNSTSFMEISYNKKAKIKEFKTHSQIKALMIRDVKSCLRDTSLAINCLLGLVMAPLMVGIFGMMPGFSELGGGVSYSTFMMFMMGVMLLIGSNYLAVIAISREGEKFYLIKYMPINIDDYIKSKQYLAYGYVIIGAVLVGVVGLIAKSNIVAVIGITLNIILLGMAMTNNCIERDLKKPMLNWLNIKQVMKSRMTVLIPMLFGVVEAIVLLVLMLILTGVWKSTMGVNLVVWGLLSIVNLVLLLVFKRSLKDKQYKLFNNIEANNG